MKATYLSLQLGATKALLKFIRDHQGHIDQDLSACLIELENGDGEKAIQHARMVKPHGMGGITDWFPKPISEYETSEQNEHVLRALVNEWCRVISLSFEDRDSVSRDAQKGALDARVNSNGYVRCPFCGKTFSSSASGSWDGVKHVTCGVRLKLVSPL